MLGRPFPARVLRFFFRLLLIVVLFLGAAVCLLLLYEDEVKAVVISELNKRLKAEVRVDPKDIDLTLISTFPHCSIRFSNLLMYEALAVRHRDTLLFAKQLNLHFNLQDLWNKRYLIRVISLDEATLQLRRLKNGQRNYIFWDEKAGGKEQGQEPLAFALELLRLREVRIRYTDAEKDFETNLVVKELNLKGRFSENSYGLKAQGDLNIRKYSRGAAVFLKDKDCQLDLDFDVRGPQYTIRHAGVTLNRLRVDLSGGFVVNDSLQSLDLQFKAPELDIASVLSLLPGTLKKDIGDYQSEGSFYLNGRIVWSKEQALSVTSDFGVRDGRIIYKPNSATASDLHLDGQFRYDRTTSLLHLKKIRMRLNNDEITGDCLLHDFEHLRIDAGLHTELDLRNLQNFLAIDTLRMLKGNLKIDGRVRGLLDDLQRQTFSEKVHVELEAVVSQLEAGFKNDEQVFTVENCQLTASGRDIEVKDLRLKRGSSDIQVNGRLPGFFNFLSDNKAPLTVDGQLSSDQLRLEDFMVRYTSSGGEGPIIPENIRFQLGATIKNFSYAKFTATAIRGEIEIKDQKAVVTDMKLRTMGGDATIDAFADNSGRRLEVAVQSRLRDINVSQLFTQLDNFGQTTLSDKNIKGIASADLEFSGSWNNRLEADLKSMHAVCNLKVLQGELIDFKPLQSLARFVDVSELQRVKFADLQSTIRIDNQIITLPKTTINNSALNLDVSGTHSFDNHIDYRIRLLLSELIAKRRKGRDDEFGPVENDPENRRSAFIRMSGTVDHPEFDYDKAGFKEKIKEDLHSRNQDAKRVLREELGLFKKDTGLRQQKKVQPRFELEKTSNNPPKKTLEPKRKQEDDDF